MMEAASLQVLAGLETWPAPARRKRAMADATFAIRLLQADDYAGWPPMARLQRLLRPRRRQRPARGSGPKPGAAASAGGTGARAGRGRRRAAGHRPPALPPQHHPDPGQRLSAGSIRCADGQGGGIARALLLAAAERARGDGAAMLYWRTAGDNHTARRLYDQVAELADAVIYRQVL